jgi:hypothetical protein
MLCTHCNAQKTADLKAVANNRYHARFAASDADAAFYEGKINGFQRGVMKRHGELMIEEADKLEAKWRNIVVCIHNDIAPTDCFTAW